MKVILCACYVLEFQRYRDWMLIVTVESILRVPNTCTGRKFVTDIVDLYVYLLVNNQSFFINICH